MTYSQDSLFPEPQGTWRAPASLPELSAYDRLAWDTETTGLDVLHDKPVGTSLRTPDGKRWYLPWGHRGGGNLDEGLCKRWTQRELRGKELIGANVKFDHHMFLNWGVDLEAQGCKFRDVQYQAALLDDHRRSVRLDLLAQERLGRKKLALPDKLRLADLPASLVGPYAEEDADLTWCVFEAQQPDIIAQDLTRVQDLEDALTPVTTYMERQRVHLDVPKLKRWRQEVTEEYSRRIIHVAQETGVRVNPSAPNSVGRLLEALKVKFDRTSSGIPSITDQFLKSIDNPLVREVNEARQLDSLRSKYLDKYARALLLDLLAYQLHQLRGDEYGTISGRYSSSNVNIQQVFHPEKQLEKFGELLSRWIVRELFVPAPGARWLSADANQIEYRLVAHYANSHRLLKAYNEDPNADFHQVVAAMVHMTRKRAKNVNYGKVYGMGRDKMAAMIGLPRREELTVDYVSEEVTPTADGCFEAYDREFPEIRRLMNRCMEIAKRRGYVHTLMGRLARFPDGQRLHSALNRVVQGSAAEIMKLKLLELYREQKSLGFNLRFTVHDEVDGDLYEPDNVPKIKELLNAPCLPLKVPITWEVSVGDNWRLA